MNHATNLWLETAMQKLSRDGFEISRDIPSDKYTFKVIACRNKSKIFGLGDAFFIFAEFDILDIDELRKFSAYAFNAAQSMKFAQVELGEKLRNDLIVGFPVAIVRNVEKSTIDAIRIQTPPRHLGAFEIPILFDEGQQQLYYFEKTPFWGFVFFFGFRALIRKYLLQTN
jgi:hypothetical protein